MNYNNAELPKNTSHFQATPEELAVLATLKNPDDRSGPTRQHDFHTSQQVLTLLSQGIGWHIAKHYDAAYFEDESHRNIFKIYRESWNTVEAVPSREIMMILLKEKYGESPHLLEMLAEVEVIAQGFACLTADSSAIQKLMIGFLHEQQKRALVLKLLDKKISMTDFAAEATALANLQQDSKSDQTPKFFSSLDLWAYKSNRVELIPNVLISGTHTLLTAREKKGKTHWLSNMISDALALGVVGKVSVQPIPVFYLDFEMGIDLYRDYYFARLFPKPDDPTFHNVQKYFHYLDSSCLPPFLTLDWLGKLVAGEKGLFVIDTVRGAFSAHPETKKVSAWENDASLVGSLLRPIGDFCHKTGWNVITIHHNNKKDEYSGSTEFGASADAYWSFQGGANNEDTRRYLSVLGRGVYGNYSFDFSEGRYVYSSESVVDIEKWVLEQYTVLPPGTTQNDILARRGSLPDNKIRHALQQLVNEGTLKSLGHKKGFQLNS